MGRAVKKNKKNRLKIIIKPRNVDPFPHQPSGSVVRRSVVSGSYMHLFSASDSRPELIHPNHPRLDEFEAPAVTSQSFCTSYNYMMVPMIPQQCWSIPITHALPMFPPSPAGDEQGAGRGLWSGFPVKTSARMIQHRRHFVGTLQPSGPINHRLAPPFVSILARRLPPH